jgi:hypothetical protein
VFCILNMGCLSVYMSKITYAIVCKLYLRSEKQRHLVIKNKIRRLADVKLTSFV